MIETAEEEVFASEAARRFSLPCSTLCNWLKRGLIRNARRVGKQWLLNSAALDELQKLVDARLTLAGKGTAPTGAESRAAAIDLLAGRSK